MKAKLTGSSIKLTGLSDGAIDALDESVYGMEADTDVEVFARTRTTATIPVDTLGDVIDGLKGHADHIDGDWIIDCDHELTEEFEAAVRSRKLKCIARLQKTLARYADKLNEAREGLSSEYYTRVEGPQVITLDGKPTQVLAIGFGDGAIGDVTIVRQNGGVMQFLDGEWSA